jgi:hypothetical protein
MKGDEPGSTLMVRVQERYPPIRNWMRWRPASTCSVEGVFPTKLPSIRISAPGGLLLKSTKAGSSGAANGDARGTALEGVETTGVCPLVEAG